MQLMLDEPISNALVGHVAWSSVAVQNQRTVLLGPSRMDEAQAMIHTARMNASTKALALFEDWSQKIFALLEVAVPSFLIT
jgi:hypothetical protein